VIENYYLNKKTKSEDENENDRLPVSMVNTCLIDYKG